ncbi:MAG TPA: universal stress protein [Desulfurobacteriaceae bacterium]|nr:universal stress protein [Desulfurobacteriaceae bacterium]
MISKLLFPSKLYENDFIVLKNITPLKEVGLQEVVFLYVIEPELVVVPKTGELLKDEIEKLKNIASAKFKEWSEYLEKFNIKTKFYILVGDPAEKILEVSEKENVSLITISYKKRRKFFKFFLSGLGSTTLTLLKVTYFPIIVFPHDFTQEKNIFSDILISIDFSKNSEEVINYVVNLRPLVKRVILVYIADKEESIDKMEEIKIKLDAYKDILKEKGIETYSYIYYGRVAEKILEAAKKHNVNLIAMGITGKDEEEKRRFDFFFIGSTAQNVVNLSDLPVLLIPPKREKLPLK